MRLPRLLEGELVIRGYPLEMVLAEKLVTPLARGTVNTRWRDFVDVWMSRRLVNVRGRLTEHSIVSGQNGGAAPGGAASAAARRRGSNRRFDTRRTERMHFVRATSVELAEAGARAEQLERLQ